MGIDRGPYDELDDAIAQRRERSLLENEIAALQSQVRDMKRGYDSEIDLLKIHVGRLESSQNEVLAKMETMEMEPVDPNRTRPYNDMVVDKFIRATWWQRVWVTVSRWFKRLRGKRG